MSAAAEVLIALVVVVVLSVWMINDGPRAVAVVMMWATE